MIFLIMRVALLPPQTLIHKIAYLSVLPVYQPYILYDYAEVNPLFAQVIWDILCKEIKHLEDSHKRWLEFNTSEEGWTLHLSKCGYKIP